MNTKKLFAMLLALVMMLSVMPMTALAADDCADGHTIETVAAKAPTCQDAGLTEGKKCSVCGYIEVAQKVIPGTDHHYENKIISAPTCTADGVAIAKCRDCGAQRTAMNADGLLVEALQSTAYLICGSGCFNLNAGYIIDEVNSFFFDGWDYNNSVEIPAEEYEAMIRKYFVIDDAMLQSIRAYGNNSDHAPTKYNADTNTYTLTLVGGMGGWLDENTYLGYVKNGTTYTAYYGKVNYVFLRDLLPEGVDEYDYYEELGEPETFEYEGYTFQNGIDGIYSIASVEKHGRAMEMEFNDNVVRIISVKNFTEADLPAKFDDVDGKATGHKDADGNKFCDACNANLGAGPTDFSDVPSDAWFLEPVKWAVEHNITNGVAENLFAPDDPCTRGQVVTFLWRAAGKPTPTTEVNPFTDVAADMYYYDAVLWAVENGITNGMTDTTFEPDTTCTRGQIVTLLWRAAGQPDFAAYTNPFTDLLLDMYYYDAVLWAVENSITNGMTDTTFEPDSTCTRGQIVTFLYRTVE